MPFTNYPRPERKAWRAVEGRTTSIQPAWPAFAGKMQAGRRGTPIRIAGSYTINPDSSIDKLAIYLDGSTGLASLDAAKRGRKGMNGLAQILEQGEAERLATGFVFTEG